MKWIKTFRIFESLKDEIDLEEVEDRLIDFKQLNFNVTLSLSSSLIIDFDKKERETGQFYINSSELNKYVLQPFNNNSFTVNLEAKSGQIELFNIDELDTYYNYFSSYLNSAYGLVPNYIYSKIKIFNRRGGYGGFLYFKDFQSIRQFLNDKEQANYHMTGRDPIDQNKLQIEAFSLGFYK
jgi:hypothetical protein